MSGWFAVKHGICNHPVFRGRWERVGWFIWLVDNACDHPTEISIAGKPYTVPRGALCFAERFLATKFGISQKALRTFLKDLQEHGVIRQTTATTGQGTKSKRKQITFCNYDKYQLRGSKTEAKRKQNGSKEKQRTVPVGKDADAPSIDPVKLMFDSGVALLTNGGTTQAHARSMLGKWRKEYGTEAVLTAIGKTEREGAIDPLEFMAGIFRHQRKSGQVERPGYTHGGAFGMIPERN